MVHRDARRLRYLLGLSMTTRQPPPLRGGGLVIQHRSTQWLIWWRVCNPWKMLRHKSTQLSQWIGARLNGLHRRELQQSYSGSVGAVARMYHPDYHDCLTLTGSVDW